MAFDVMAGVGLLKGALDILKGIKTTNDAAVRNAAVTELHEKILSAYEEHAALTQRIRELEEEVASFETWECKKQRYELQSVGTHAALVYMLKSDVEPPEIPHQICVHCYGNRQKSVLQPEKREHGREHLLICHRCSAEIFTFGTRTSR